MSLYVLGAGVTGLAFARSCGGQAVILEAGPAAGGKARSYTVETAAGRFGFDTGGHWFHRQNAPEVLALLEGLPLVRHERRAYVLLNGKRIGYPLQQTYEELSDRKLVQRIRRELNSAVATGGEARQYEELLLRTFGPTLYRLFFGDYNRKMYGVRNLREIAVGSSGYEALRNVKPAGGQGYNREFWYPASGGAEAIARHLARGLDIRLNSPVRSIRLRNRTLACGDSELSWRTLVSTLPLPLLVGLIEDADPAMKRLARSLKASRGFILNLGVRRNERHDGVDWLYAADPKLSFYRLGFYSNVNSQLAPEGFSSMYVECSPLRFSGRNEALALLPTVLDELRTLGFIRDADDVAVIHPVYLEHNYCLPQPEAVAVLRAYLRERGIHSIGRYGSWHWSSQHEDMRQAMKLAEELRRAARR
ncbi:protoporphyrinogen/coproporphyrinogen oxidase [Gorillibacterium sp. sgz500922]|uniref:protoporphyrinogen/coproporphyrinogen oxidase n=1 Tax=Gorillibacterium sp. sgz500922 TaxID=3446694 RepID=UPI003F68009E